MRNEIENIRKLGLNKSAIADKCGWSKQSFEYKLKSGLSDRDKKLLFWALWEINSKICTEILNAEKKYNSQNIRI